jgi:hypothetical protein
MNNAITFTQQKDVYLFADSYLKHMGLIFIFYYYYYAKNSAALARPLGRGYFSFISAALARPLGRGIFILFLLVGKPIGLPYKNW